ncbi:hypothetical protein ACH5RR_010392 [Cinchona calisaya]|uniref:Uncharacterized protein n=1 Tax=Cinchona calisaya TaxID=153742 RepID=A0ABD3AIT2_9GENT
MVLFLFNLVFLALSTMLNIISRLIFQGTAHFIVLTIQAFKLPGQAVQGLLEKLGDVIKACLEYLVELVIEAISTLISSLFDLVKDGVSGSATAAGSAIGGLATLIDGLVKDLPEVLQGFSEMITTVATDLWDNYKDALGYINENL